MVKVLITKDCEGSDDGITVREFIKGTTVEINDGLARAFVVDMHTAKYEDNKDENKSPGPSRTNDVLSDKIETPEKGQSLESMDWRKVKSLVIAKGGTWSDKANGILFLRGK